MTAPIDAAPARPRLAPLPARAGRPVRVGRPRVIIPIAPAPEPETPADVERRRWLRARTAHNRDQLTAARAAAGAALGKGPGTTTATAGAAAATVVGLLCPHLPRPLWAPAAVTDPAAAVRAVLRRAAVGWRPVQLQARWWATSDGPMIGFAAGGRPVALVPARGGYRVVDPHTGRAGDARSHALELAPVAYAIAAPLPQGALTLGRIAKVALAGSRRDVVALLAAGFVAAVLGLGVPIATGTVVPQLLTTGAASQVAWLAVLLAAAAGAAALLLVVRDAAALRLQGRLQASLEPAVWARLVALAPAFFRQYSTGELVQRAGSIAQARKSLAGAVVGAFLGALFSLSSLVVVIAVDPVLGLLTVGGAAVIVVVVVILARRQQEHEREVFRLYGDVYGKLYETLTGVDKLQTAGREIQGFSRWADLFGRQKVADAATLRAQALLTATVAATQPFLLLVVIGGATAVGASVAPNALVVVAVALGQVALALGQFSQLAGTVYGLRPVLERLQPIIDAPLEVGPDAADPGPLGGAVALEHASFAYPGAARPCVNDVSLYAAPGEMIAVVGASGAGKSTILRLLLGFETPSAGQVTYDGRDLATLDVRAVRSQLGVVLQDSRLVRGSLRDNLLGSATELGDDAAWAAAELAGVADDLRRLPLGLATRVGEGTPVFSGGQTQRLLIARALVRRPRLLLLDEATSALDNRTQRLVSDAIAGLAMTRVVIAHRLSTIRHADRIYVFADGAVVDHGTYDQLVTRGGVFADLVHRQEI